MASVISWLKVCSRGSAGATADKVRHAEAARASGVVLSCINRRGAVSVDSGENSLDHFSMDVSESVISTLEPMNQTLVIEP